MVAEAVGAGAVGGLAVGALVCVNALRDRGMGAATSRRLAAVLGGVGYLLAVMLLDVRAAIAVSGALTLLIIALRLGARGQLRGLSSPAHEGRWSEVAYVGAGTAALIVGWGVLGDRWLAFLPIAFMAWGDSAAGFARALRPARLGRDPWPSAAMLAVGLAAALLYAPYTVGALGAVAATAAERFHPTTHALWDDNWLIVALSLGAMHGALLILVR